MKDPETDFEEELEVFRTEVQSGTQFFYSYLAIYAEIGKNKKALDGINKTPLFWATNIGALHTASFISLGRIFDQKSNHNVDRLIRKAQNYPHIFSKPALGKRKKKGSPNADEWLPDDFRRIRKHVKKYRKIYEQNYKDIRRKIFAHKELSDKSSINELYKKTQIGELQKIFIFLNKLYEAFWELYHNGRKPVLRPMRHSVVSITEKRRQEWESRGVHENIVSETQDFFKLFTLKTQPPH